MKKYIISIMLLFFGASNIQAMQEEKINKTIQTFDKKIQKRQAILHATLLKKIISEIITVDTESRQIKIYKSNDKDILTKVVDAAVRKAWGEKIEPDFTGLKGSVPIKIITHYIYTYAYKSILLLDGIAINNALLVEKKEYDEHTNVQATDVTKMFEVILEQYNSWRKTHNYGDFFS